MNLIFFKKFKIKSAVWLTLLLLVLASIIVFVENKQNQKTLNNVIVNIQNEYENYFIDEREILKLITDQDRELLIHKNYDSINLKRLEKRILTHHFVQDAQVSKDHKGNLVVNVAQCRPLARVIPNEGASGYISDQGVTLTTSEKFTARVLIVDGDFTKRMMQPHFFSTAIGQPYFELLTYIHSVPFWKAQIAQLTINKYGEITITPQLGSEIIDFGTPENHEEKLNKLMLFYKKILPTKGWNTYQVVKLRFKDQIVCEKALATL